MTTTDAGARRDWERLRRAIRGETLPLALLDLDAFDANVEHVMSAARVGKKKLRIASKSVRSPRVLRRIADASGGVAIGVMAYAAGELPLLLEHGFTDVLLAYPTVQASDLAQVARANAAGARASLVVDCIEHVEAASQIASTEGVRIPIVVDVDVAYRPIAGVHVGVRRSPLRAVAAVLELAERIAARAELRFEGVMLYEAHLAGLSDRGMITRGMKSLARSRVLDLRSALVDALRRSNLAPAVVNGGGSGTLHANVLEPALTEVTVGSAFFASHLFDHYRDLRLAPAAFFALQVARRSGRSLITCHGGGWIASGPPGFDRLPVPSLPPGLTLLRFEGAGEVQTPLRTTGEVPLAIGDPVFFRHAKAGELAEHVNELLLVRGDVIVERARTYRGLGLPLLG
jgi:D-serine deaminase-like pyridoxal phosphate-dependent protein